MKPELRVSHLGLVLPDCETEVMESENKKRESSRCERVPFLQLLTWITMT